MTGNQNIEIKSIEKIDRLSELPDPICHHILSFLPSQDIITTSYLSRRWRFLWYTRSSYEFHERDFRITYDETKDSKIIKFLKFAGTTLKFRKRYFSDLVIEKLSISMSNFSQYRYVVAKWIAFAVDFNVKELHITGIDYKGCVTFFPRMILDAILNSSLTALEIRNIYYFDKSFVSWGLPFLQKLVLEDCCLSELTVKNILSNCPEIKSIYLHCPNTYAGEIIFSSETILDFDVMCRIRKLVVDAPNLECFSFSDAGIPSSVHDFRLVSCRFLRSLNLCFVDRMTDSMLEDILGRNQLLESLDICDCQTFKNLVICLPKLRRLKVMICTSLESLKINTPNLEKLEFEGDMITFTFVGSLSLLVADIIMIRYYSVLPSLVWYTRLKDLCQKLGKSKRLSLRCSRQEDLIVPMEWREILLPDQVCNLNHLEVEIFLTQPLNLKLIEEGVRWIFPSLRTLDIYGWKEPGHQVKHHFKYYAHNSLRPEANQRGVYFNYHVAAIGTSSNYLKLFALCFLWIFVTFVNNHF